MAKKLIKPLSEMPEKGNVSKDYFFRMMSTEASKIAKPYLDDERALLLSLLESLGYAKDYNLVVVGAGRLSFLKIGLEKADSYTCIEPLSSLFMGDEIKYLIKRSKDVRVVDKTLANVKTSDLPVGKRIIVFMFNILAYIENPMLEINRLIQKGDILFISTWNTTQIAKQIRREYFGYLNSFEKSVIIDPEKTVGICNLGNFPFDKLKLPQNHRFRKTDVVESLEIYL